jgi:hypothetical protein
MFDNDPSLPATGSRLSQVWLRVTGKDRWLTTQATVYSVGWRSLPDEQDSPVGYYDVVFSYRVNDEIYSGKFSDYGMEAEDYLHRNDQIPIRYNPAHPERNYYPDLRTSTSYTLLCAAIGAGAGVVTLLIAYFRHTL